MSRDTDFDWGRHIVPDDEAACLRLGPLELRFLRRADELRLHWSRENEDVEEPLRWSRWAVGEEWDGEMELTPAFPDRLVVVKPEEEFRLMPGASARVYLRIPLHVEVRLRPAPSPPLASVPTAIMSDTWWGTPQEGELGYWLDTLARRDVRSEEFEEHLCVCPLQLRNRAREDLQVDKVALRVEHLTVYRDEEHLWADETRVRYLGEEEGSRIDMAGRPPPDAPGAHRLAPPRIPMERGFSARTFARLRSSFGGWL
jgi:hypothetical protein